MFSALVSHGESREFESGRRRRSYPAVEMNTRSLELGKDRRSGGMLPTSPSGVPTSQRKYGH